MKREEVILSNALWTLMSSSNVIYNIYNLCGQAYWPIYRAFHGFGQAKFAYGDGGPILGLSQLTLLVQLLLKKWHLI